MKLIRISLLALLSFCMLSDSAIVKGVQEKTRHEMLRYEFNRLAGEEVIQNISSKERGRKFIDILSDDESWLTDMLDSGPVKNPQLVLSFLYRVWFDDGTVQHVPINRSMATACALAMGMNTRLEEEWMWKRYVYFRDNWKDGLLNKCYGDLSMWERRYLARGPEYSSYSSVEAMEYLRDRVCVPRSAYVDACGEVSYRSYNCLGDSVQTPDYYVPFRGIYGCDPEMAIEVGGVCGALSNLGTAAAIANGVPATSMGEPGHCAYTVQVEPSKWQAANTISWNRSMHTWLYRATWPSLMMEQACFGEMELVSQAGHLMRMSHWYEDQGDIVLAEKLIVDSTRLHPMHYGLWQERAEFGIRNNLDLAWWNTFNNDVLEYLGGSNEEPAWAILRDYVYGNMQSEMTDAGYIDLFWAYMNTFESFGQGRWEIENAWNWMLEKISDAELRDKFENQLVNSIVTKAGMSEVVLEWKKQRCGEDKDSWLAFQSWLVMRLSEEDGEEVNSIIRNLGRTALPFAVQQGDLVSYQLIGKLCTRVYESSSVEGIEPFEGELLTEGGFVNLSGIGEHYDTPEKHWGVLNMHGGALHTNSIDVPWVEIKLGNSGILNGLVIQNREGAFLERADGARVFVSRDGKDWQQVCVLEGAKKIYRVDLSGLKPDAGWIRIERDGKCMHFARILAYGESDSKEEG